MSQLAKGLNYEWSHRSEKTTSGAVRVGSRHITTMQDDLHDLRDILQRFHLDIPLTILQTGFSATDEDEAVPEWASSQAWLQAVEVYRRLGGALAAGAEAVGWESWMSIITTQQANAGREGSGMGLRQDTESTTAAARAMPRESWSAYQRFTSFFAATRSADFLTDADSGLVIIAFRTGHRFLYLAFIDTSYTSTVGFRLTATQQAGARVTATVRQQATLADLAQLTYLYDRTTLRTIEPIFAEAETLSMSTGSIELTLTPGQDPILITSTHALTWTTQRGGTPDIDRPEEWDITV